MQFVKSGMMREPFVLLLCVALAVSLSRTSAADEGKPLLRSRLKFRNTTLDPEREDEALFPSYEAALDLTGGLEEAHPSSLRSGQLGE